MQFSYYEYRKSYTLNGVKISECVGNGLIGLIEDGPVVFG